MQLKKFIFDLSSLITDIEIDSNLNAKQISQMVRVLMKLWRSFNNAEKYWSREQIIGMKERLKKIEIKDKDKELITDLKTDIEALETIIAIMEEKN